MTIPQHSKGHSHPQRHRYSTREGKTWKTSWPGAEMAGFGTEEAGMYVNAWGEGRKARVDQSVVSLGRPTSLEAGCRSQETCALKITSVDEAVEDAVADFVLGIRSE